MYKDFKVSLIIPAYNEEATIASVVRDYRAIEALDEILVVDNNSRDRTAELARGEGARVIMETRQGYGHALRAGMDQAEGEILILTEGDGSFHSSDVAKFLAYVKDADLVMGTRTLRQLVEPGARMNRVIRAANICWGKILQSLWLLSNATRLTDVGCTYRAVWKRTYLRLKPGLRAAGPEFSPEMMAEALRQGMKVVEIPVKYLPRMGGSSKHSVSYYHLARTALKMLRTILLKRVERSGIPPGARP